MDERYDIVRHHISPWARILEIGAGRGEFAKAASENNRVEAWEPRFFVNHPRVRWKRHHISERMFLSRLDILTAPSRYVLNTQQQTGRITPVVVLFNVIHQLNFPILEICLDRVDITLAQVSPEDPQYKMARDWGELIGEHDNKPILRIGREPREDW